MYIIVMELYWVVGWFTSVGHLSYANVLVIAHIWFSIFLLGFGSPYMGHHFQVQVTCHLQGRSLGGLEAEGSFCCYLFVLHVNQAKSLFCIKS